MAALYPLTFKPVYKDYLWGGDRIIRSYARGEPPGIYAESWEISDRPEGMSVVNSGPAAGKSLLELIKTEGSFLLGEGIRQDHFPLLIKLIDSRQVLSVQVHPDDDTAGRYGGDAKTEMWYVIEADPGACVYSGFQPGTTQDQFDKALEDGTVDELLNKVPVQAGDAVFTPGGRVHAIGAGCLLLEVQQNSNTTYRIYDWGRTDADGNPRDLHLDEARRVIQWEDCADPRVPVKFLGRLGENERWEVLATPYFRLEKLVIKETWNSAMDDRSFHGLFLVEGSVTAYGGNEATVLRAGTSCLVPAGLSEYRLEPEGDAATILRYTVP